MELARIDLNLLVSLDALLAERNVTKAAARRHISQPALSAQLAKLRQIFNDPLLLPAESGRGMRPTARALALQGPLRSALKNLGAVIQSEPAFDPFKDARTFRIAIADIATSVISLPLIERLAASAGENVRIAFSVPDPEHIAAHMEEGELDLLIDSDRIVPQGMKRRILLKDAFVMAQRKEHPRGKGKLGMDTYCRLRHVVASPERGAIRGYMDTYLKSAGRQRNTALSVPQIMMVPEILRTSDYVCTLPRRLLAPFADVVDVFELPFRPEHFTLAMAWHARDHADPAVKWLRELVTGIASSEPQLPAMSENHGAGR